jgi:adenine phosphoribosyltransferase
MGLLKLDDIKSLILDVEGFPKPGIIFKDITPIFENALAFESLIEHMASEIPSTTTKLVAIESRGFILGSALSLKTKIPFALVRKKGKLPRQTFSQSYSLEYGNDELFIHQDSLKPNDKVVIVDDVLATGGTAGAVEKLCAQCNVTDIRSLFFIELMFLQGKKNLKFTSESLVGY